MNNDKFPLPDESFRKGHFENFVTSDIMGCGIAGSSILGRDLYYYKIGKGRTHVMIFGAHHAMEHITATILYNYIDFMVEKAARGGVHHGFDIKFYLQRFTFWVFPCVNPDGVEMALCGALESPLYDRQIKMNGGSSDFSDWQANSRGVDLNHNYDHRFFEYKRSVERELGITAGRTKYSGEYPESEPEVRAVASYVRTLMPSLLISLHSQGEEIYFSPSDRRTEFLARAAASITGYTVVHPEGSAAFGGLSDFSGSLGIPSLTIEVGKGKNPLPYEKLPSMIEPIRKMLFLLPAYI